MTNILLKLYVLIPLILLMVTVLLIIKGNKKLKQYSECKGVIIGFYKNTSEIGLNAYEHKAISPIISYSVNEKEYEFIGNVYSTTMKEGKEVKVLHDKTDPSKAVMKAGILFAPLITGALAVFFVVPVIVYVILKSKGLVIF